MKILHIINSLAMGGAEALVLLEAQELVRRGNDVTIITLQQGQTDMIARFASAGLNVHLLRHHGIKSIYEYMRLIGKISPDVIHTHLYPALLYGNIARLVVRGAKFFHTEHNTTNNRRKWYLWPLDIGMYIQLTNLICISNGVKNAAVNWNPWLGGGKAVVIANTFPRSEPKREYKLNGKYIRLLSVGRLVPDKNHEFQLQLASSMPEVRIDIYGDGPLLARLQQTAGTLGVASRVRFMGVSPDLTGVYKDYDGYLHTATLEGFGLVVAEAMSAGLPVIVPDIPGIKEVAGEAGLVYESGSLEELKRHIESLFSMSVEMREKIGRESILASQEFSLDNHVNKLAQLYLQRESQRNL